MTAADREDAGRRRAPRLWDTDWLVLRSLRHAIAEALTRLTRGGDVVLDLGCGTQPYRTLFEARGAAYLGADFGTSAEVTIREDGHVCAQDKSADLVVSFQVLEHVRNLGLYLAEARRVLRPDGRLLLSTHGTWLYHAHPEDHRRWTREGLIHELATHGFRTEQCVPIVGPLAWTTLIRLTGFAYAVRKLPLTGSSLAAVLAVVMNLRAWLEDRVTPSGITRDNACVYLVTASPVTQ